MKIFISYSHTNAEIAELLAARLKAEGYKVFWDRTSLPSGESFDDRIRDGIQDSDLFICLIDQASLAEGKYARTELKFAREKWPNPSGHVLPVALDDDVMKALPAYLKSVTVQRPEGDPVAEVVAEVSRVAGRPMRRFLLAARAIGIVVVAGGAGVLAIRGLPNDSVHLSADMSGSAFYATPSVEGGTQVLRPATPYLELLRCGLNGEEPVDGEELGRLLGADRSLPRDDTSPHPIVRFRIVNDSDQTVVVDRLRLLVSESRLDLRPLLWSSAGSRMPLNASFKLGNSGWGPAEKLRFEFDIVPESGLKMKVGKTRRRFNRGIPTVVSGGEVVVRFWEELAAFGPEISFLRDGPHPLGDQMAEQRFHEDSLALRAALGAGASERIYAIGTLSYGWGDDEEDKLALKQQLLLDYPRGPFVGQPMPPSAEYDIQLDPQNHHYSRERQISHSLKPTEAERIDVRVWVEKSSLHDMTTSVRVDGKWVEANMPLRLEYYRPVGSTWRAEQVSTGTGTGWDE